VLALVALQLLIVSGCGGGTTSSTSGEPFAAIAMEPASVSMARGNQRLSTLNTQVGGSFSGSLALSAAGAPDGMTVTFDPPSVAGSGSSNVTVSVARGTPTGTYAITISGNGGGLNKTTTLTVVVSAEVLLTWTASTGDVIGYNVSRSDTSGAGYVRLNSESISGTSYIDNAAQSEHTYYYVVTAVSSTGVESPPSEEASADVP